MPRWNAPESKKLIERTLDLHPEFEREVTRLREGMGLSWEFASAQQAEAELNLARLRHPELAAQMDALVDKIRAMTLFTEADLSERYGKFHAGLGFLCKAEALDEMFDWLAEPLTLEKPESTRYHKFVEDCDMIPKDKAPQLFLVQHDWAGATASSAEIADGCEFRTPAQHCGFEFKISGRRVITLTVADDQGVLDLHDGAYASFVETAYGWCPAHERTAKEMIRFPERQPVNQRPLLHRLHSCVFRQIRAICICLEAEAVDTEVVRAPYKMNRARERRGKLPIYDYHIVRLHNRVRRPSLPAELRSTGEDVRHRRLHFVRGHYRHYPNHKTWIKWHLRGDPDLGFIDKEYRL